MEFTPSPSPLPEARGAFSVILVERVLREADSWGLNSAWAQLPLVTATMHLTWGAGFLTSPRRLAAPHRRIGAVVGSPTSP